MLVRTIHSEYMLNLDNTSTFIPAGEMGLVVGPNVRRTDTRVMFLRLRESFVIMNNNLELVDVPD